MILRGSRDAFDTSRENLRTLDRYDTASFPVANYAQLLARRMVEQGCGFVMVGNASWDMHGGKLEQPIRPGIRDIRGALDKALSAFVEDVEQRGLRDKVLLVVTGEMGRTPKINENGGRDHWGRLSPLLLYGADTEPGVVGASDRSGGEPVRDARGQGHLFATILHQAFDVGALRVARGIPTQLVRQLDELEPIHGAST